MFRSSIILIQRSQSFDLHEDSFESLKEFEFPIFGNDGESFVFRQDFFRQLFLADAELLQSGYNDKGANQNKSLFKKNYDHIILLRMLLCKEILCKLLIVISDNVIIQLLWFNWPRFIMYQITNNTVLYMSMSKWSAYCYHLVSVINQKVITLSGFFYII